MNPSTEELLYQVSIDNRRAFDMFYNLYYKQVFHFTYYQLKNTEACREVVSNVFFSLWKSRTSLIKIKSIEAYLYTIAKNEILHYLSRHTNYQNISIDEIPIQLEMHESDNPEKRIINEEIETLISKIIDQLPEKCKLIFLMNRNEGLKNSEIAERLSLSESTIRVQMKIAIEKIIEQVKKHYPNLSFAILLCLILQ